MSPLSPSQRKVLNDERKKLRLEMYRAELLYERLVSILAADGPSEEVVKIEVHG
jgi:hypothetical protein